MPTDVTHLTPADLPPRGEAGGRPALLGELGGFWADAHADRPLLAALLDGPARAAEAYALQAEQAADAASRLTVRPLREHLWTPVTFRAVDRGAGGRPGCGRGSRAGAGRLCGGPAGDGKAWYPLPPGLVDLPALANRLADASAVLVRGVDYDVRDGAIGFLQDPVLDPRCEPADGPAGAGVRLWAWRARVDAGDLQDGWAFPLGVRAPPTALGRDAVNAAWAAVQRGPTREALAALLAAGLGCPTADGVERVRAVVSAPDARVVVTTRTAHRAGPAATPNFVVGDVPPAGAFLFDTVRLDDVRRGLPPGLKGLAVGPAFLPAGVGGPLLFEHAVRPVTLTRTGHARFPVQGDPRAVARFWAAADAEGVRLGRTVAQALSADAGGALPPTVDPAAFLARTLWRTVLLVTVKPAGVPPGAPGLSALARLLPLAAPPRSAVLVRVVREPAAGVLAYEREPTGGVRHPARAARGTLGVVGLASGRAITRRETNLCR